MKIFYLLLAFYLSFHSPDFFAQNYLGNYSQHLEQGNAISFIAGASSLRLIFYKPDIVRIDLLPTVDTIIDSSFVIIRDTTESIGYSLTEFIDRFQISTSSLSVSVNKFPLRLSIYDGSGRIILSEPSAGGLSFSGPERKFNFELYDEDHFYGTGERGTQLDKRGQNLYSYNTQSYGYNTPLETMNINIPFFVNPNGYAIYIDNTYPGRFDFGSTSPDKFSYTAYGGELSFYVMVTETIQAQLREYIWLTGQQPLPPKWALGFIQSKYGYRNETEARNVVQTIRQKHIPCDALVIDLYWFTHMGDIAWNFASWPDPFQMMIDFLDQGIKTVLITEPYIVQYSSNFQTAYANNYFTFNSQGIPVLLPNWWSCNCDAGLIDFTNPEAVQWWWSKHPLFFGSELAGIWTDLGEPEQHPVTMNHYLGSRDKIHNIYNFLWSQFLFNEISDLRPDKRVFNLTRSGFAGSQRFGIIPWSGDVARSFGGLKVQLPMLLNMGMSGLAYHNSDIGGFCCGTTTPELYVRWMQYGAFSPITRAHGHDSQPTEPWGFGTTAESISRNYINLRYQLLPYNYSMSYENYLTGLPLARPLFLDYPGDVNLINYSEAYLWGNSFLVSPVTESGQTSKSIYLPEGEWVDFFNDEVYPGGATYTVLTPLVKLPLFVKRGSIIPMQPLMQFTEEFPVDTLILAIYPSQHNSASFSLYEDDGSSLDYQSGGFGITEFSQNYSSSDVLNLVIGPSLGQFSGKLSNRIYLSDIRLIGSEPASVLRNGIPLTKRLSYGDLRNSTEGYFFDDQNNRLYAQIKGNADSSYLIQATGIILSAGSIADHSPDNFILEQNFPNPFNSSTTITWQLPFSSNVIIKIYNTLGQEIYTFLDEYQEAGLYSRSLKLDPGIPSGVYFYRLQAVDAGGNKRRTFVDVKKMLLIK